MFLSEVSLFEGEPPPRFSGKCVAMIRAVSKSFFSFWAVLTAVLFLCSSCARSTDQNKQITSGLSSSVTLKMYLPGEESKSFSKVLDQINAILSSRIGATLDISFISPSKMLRQYPTLFTNGTDFDLVYVSSDANYMQRVANHYYLEITQDLLKDNAPALLETIPDQLWEQVKANDKVYMIPSSSDYSDRMVFLIRKDLLDKYGLDTPTSLDELEQYLKLVASNEEGMIPYQVGETGLELLQAAFLQPRGLTLVDQNALLAAQTEGLGDSLISLTDYAPYLDYLQRIYSWKQLGLIPSNAAARRTVTYDAFRQGDSALYIGDLDSALLAQMLVEQDNRYRLNEAPWEASIIDLSADQPTGAFPHAPAGIAIRNGSQHVGLALQVIDLLRNDRQLHDLLLYGIQNEHWVASGNSSWTAGSSFSDYPTNLYAKYAFGSSLDREPESPPEEYTSIRNQWKENVVQNSTINCFRPYPGERYSIVSDMELLNIKYLFPLQLGAYDDPKGYLDHYREKSRMAVVETYIQVVNDQAVDYCKRMDNPSAF